MAKLVKLDERLSIGIVTETPNQYNVHFHAENNLIYTRLTNSEESDMRTYAEHVAESIVTGTLVREDWQKKLIKWMCGEDYGLSQYYVMIDLYTEPNKQGNMTRYYLMGGGTKKLKLGGKDFTKCYVSKSGAIKAARKAYDSLFNKSLAYIHVMRNTVGELMPVEIATLHGEDEQTQSHQQAQNLL